MNPKTGKALLAAGYARTTIAHNLSAVSGFYAFHMGERGARLRAPRQLRRPARRLKLHGSSLA